MITTIGSMMVDDALPEDLRNPGRVLDKGGLKKVLTEIGEKHPEKYGEVVHNLKQIGNQAAYEAGTSFRLEDFAPNTHIRDAAMAEHQAELDELHRKYASSPHLQIKPSFHQKKLELYGKVEEKAKEHLLRHVKESPNNLTDWYRSGSRGDEHAVRQINTMIGRQVDVTNTLVPEVAKRSFSEGLSPVDYLVHAAGARKGVVATYTSVQEPGAFAKTIFNAASDMLISGHDCGSKRGRTMHVQHDAHNLLDRTLAEDVPGVGHRNDLITHGTLAAAKKAGITHLKARSPLTCEQPEGICSMDYGLSESGRLAHIGEHVGIKAAQGLSEPLTQLALNNKHGGGTVKKVSPLAEITNFMNGRKVHEGEAVLATTDGTVSAITPTAGVGHDVWIDGQRHFVHKNAGDLLVKVGDQVHRGAKLSDAQVNPSEMVAYHGMDQGRAYVADQLQDLYHKNGIKGHAKVFETISRTLLGHGQVHHAGDTDLVEGDIVKWNAVSHHMENPRVETMPVHQAEGRILAAPAHKFGAYTTLTRREVKKIQAARGNDFAVTVYHPDQPVIQPLMMGAEGAALHKGDWMANFGFKGVKGRLLKENAPTFATADIHSYNPLSAYAHGAEFGSRMHGAENGRY